MPLANRGALSSITTERINAMETQHEFDCAKCGQHKVHVNPHGSGGTGYALNDKEEKICYECCAIVDKQWMDEHDKIALYLSKGDDQRWYVTNWCGTLKFKVNT